MINRLERTSQSENKVHDETEHTDRALAIESEAAQKLWNTTAPCFKIAPPLARALVRGCARPFRDRRFATQAWFPGC